MPFIPHTLNDERIMLKSIGVTSIETLFDEIPEDLKSGELTDIPEGISEMALMRVMNERARQDAVKLSFLGAGAYEHHIPAAVWDLVGRGENREIPKSGKAFSKYNRLARGGNTTTH